MLLRLAIRNLRRNRRRTLLAGLAIGIGLGGLIFTEALMIGMEDGVVADMLAAGGTEAELPEAAAE